MSSRPYDIMTAPRKTPQGMAAFRQHLYDTARDDRELQHDLWIACKRDILFWLNAFCWTYDPRNTDCPVIPFNTWAYQDSAFDRMAASVGRQDLVFHKSRAMGLSWMILAVFAHRWQFYGDQTFLVVSRNQDLVDKKDDRDSLFWKLDFLAQTQPPWMRPQTNRKELHLGNRENGSTFDGASTTGNVGRGGRRTSVLVDEFAAFPVSDGYRALSATQAVTNSRFINSTPQGEANAYADVVQGGELDVMEFHWSLHPEYAKGLYTTQDGLLAILDDTYRFPSDYPFVLDGKMRSPWYDNECRRASGVPWLIAQELDMDFLGSVSQVFDKATLDALLSEQGGTIIAPFAEGNVRYSVDDAGSAAFQDRSGGPLRLWTHLMDGKPNPERNYVVGCDIARGSRDSAGRGASNSVASVVDTLTGEKVAEYAVSGVPPHEFARTAVALCKWFQGPAGSAFLIWEENGPGQTFGHTVVEELCFDNIYYRQAEDSLTKKRTDKWGWWTGKDNKRVLIDTYQEALSTRKFINHSHAALDECKRYIISQDGGYDHSAALAEQDPTHARANHGDRVIADALANWALKTRAETPATQADDYPQNCLKARLEERLADVAERSLVW